MLNAEIWKAVTGFEGLYEVSDRGRVRSLGAYIKSRKGKMLNAYPTSTSAYLYVKLWRDNTQHNRAVHRLVAEAFVPNPDNKPMTNHLDGDKLNNIAANLQWVTCSENNLHAYQTGLRTAESLRTRNLGSKAGTGSKYHNVSWDSARKRWKASVKHRGKMIRQRRFSSELEAARFVDSVLDAMGDTERPRNFS